MIHRESRAATEGGKGEALLLVEHGGARKEFLFRKIAEQGIELHLATSHYEPWLEPFVPGERVVRTDTHHSVRLVGDVAAYLAANRIRLGAVGTFWEHTVTETADLAAALGLTGIPPGAAWRSSSNKLLMRESCRRAGILTPRFRVFKGLENLAPEVDALGTPCVVKPVFGDDSFGVMKIERGSDIAAVVRECRSTWSGQQEAYRNFSDVWLLEEYVPGKVVSVDGLVQRGRFLPAGITEIGMGPEPRFTQCANRVPPGIDGGTAEACLRAAEQIVRALGFDDTAFHCEMRLGPEGPVLIEIAARLPGGVIVPAYERAYGIDMMKALLDLWFGREASLEPSRCRQVLQKGVFPTRPGILKSAAGYSKARELGGVWDLVEVTAPGEPVVTYPDVPKPLYVYSIEAGDPAALSALAAAVEASIEIEIEA